MKKNEAISILATSVRPREQKDRARYDEAVKMAIDALNEPERKTGKWIIEPYDAQNDIFIHRCGTCMRVAMLGGHTTKFKYCPICGSTMEGEQNVTD